MLGDTNAIATIAVRDLETAVAFYEGKLGLQRAEGGQPGVVVYRTGATTMLVYVSTFAGTNTATAVTWTGTDVEATARDLAAKGVAFEHYDQIPDAERRGDVYVAGDMRMAWFKDPDGNIHALVSG